MCGNVINHVGDDTSPLFYHQLTHDADHVSSNIILCLKY